MAGNHNEETTEAFTSRLFGIVDGGFKTLSIALGVKSGLIDALVKRQRTPVTSQELADATGLKERYVREWLAVMVSSHIVELDPETDRYHLPPHRAATFMPGGMVADYSTWVPALSDAFNPMLKALKKDGPRGLTSSEANAFTEYENSFTSAWYERCLLQEFIPSLPDMTSKFEGGIRMLDVGCGYGIGTRILAEHFPNSEFVGLDISEENVAIARESTESLSNVEYICVDGCQMPREWTSSFDYVFCCNVLHDLPRPDLIIEEIKRVMKSDAKMSVIEMNVDSQIKNNMDDVYSAFRYTISLFHCLPQSFNYPGSYGLGMMWGKDGITEFLKGNGFAIRLVTKTSVIGEAHFYCELS